MPESIYVRRAFAILKKVWPMESQVSDRVCMETVMREWDGRSFFREPANPQLETIARLALCEIGLAFSEADELPYGLTQVTERLREVCPVLGADEITVERMRLVYVVEKNSN